MLIDYALAMENQFSAFCERTSLHGLQYLGDEKTSTFKKLFWLIVIILSIISASVLIYYNTVVFNNSTVLVSVETMTAPLSEIYFPSVTVCNINQARKSFFDQLGISDNVTMIRKIHSQFLGDNKINEHVPLSPELTQKLNDAMNHHFFMSGQNAGEKSLHWAMHQKCGDMFILSKWNGTVYNSSHEVDYDFGTDYGICCWFTPQLNLTKIIRKFKTKKYRKMGDLKLSRNLTQLPRMGQMDIQGQWFSDIKKGATSGKHNGFKLLLDIESFDYNDYDEGSEGIKVT